LSSLINPRPGTCEEWRDG